MREKLNVIPQKDAEDVKMLLGSEPTHTKSIKFPQKTVKKMKQSYINDIDIIIEAIENKDLKDAVQMLQDLKEDLKIILLMC